MKLLSKLLVLALIPVVVCSCDKENGGNGDINEPKPVSVKISYSYENTADFFSLFDVDIEYLDANGATKKATFTNNAWKYEANVDYDKAPANYRCKITVRKKGVEPEDRTYKFMGLGSYKLKAVTIKDDNNEYPLGPSVDKTTTTAEMKHLSEYLERISDEGVLVYDYNYTKN